MTLAKLVFPHPGGPQSIKLAEANSPRSTRPRQTDPSPIIVGWPTKSLRLLGRICSAKGALDDDDEDLDDSAGVGEAVKLEVRPASGQSDKLTSHTTVLLKLELFNVLPLVIGEGVMDDRNFLLDGGDGSDLVEVVSSADERFLSTLGSANFCFPSQEDACKGNTDAGKPSKQIGHSTHVDDDDIAKSPESLEIKLTT